MKQRIAAIPEADRAYVVGTFAVDCSPHPRDSTKCFHAFNSISTYYRSVTDKEISGRLNSTFGGMGGDTVHDYVWPDRLEKGYQFCFVLPPGKYEVYTYNLTNFAGGGSGFSIREEGQFKVPFTLAAGELVDIGKLHITTSTGKNFFGMTLPAPGVLLLSKSSPEATRAALGKCPPNIQSRVIRDSALAASGYAPSPFVRSQAAGQQPQ